MTNFKGITMVWLSKTDLSNLNAGEGGGGNVTELKTYDNGTKPYASGQSVRHALRESIGRNNPNVFLC
ncbi:type I-B CRISPR-associated protein Cas7/Cst2/DevR, partial [Candidatus Poribacteria bacterium]